MIHVIATIELNEGCREKFLKIFKDNVLNVLKEDGCISYAPTIDTPADLPAQPPVRKNTVTVIEGWESIRHLHAHLKSPHMLEYFENVKGLVKSVSIQVTEPV